MAYSVAIIGSFQKYYNEILGVIKVLKSQGIYVSSPKESYIDGKINDFVIFESDRKDYSPEEIQMITLEKIISADVVYVYNPSGYVGKTTCYEIGFCFSKRKPIFFLEDPVDLPIPVLQTQVLNPEMLAYSMISKKLKFIDDYGLCTEAQRAFDTLFDNDKERQSAKTKKIVICGSMLFFDEMVECQRQLAKMGIEAIVPKEESEAVGLFDEERYLEFKKRVSRNYLKKIREKDTMGVLVYNAEKRGIANYIGANTLVELAMAFTWNRKIFLLNDIFPPLKDELLAWDCICLNGNLEEIKNVLLEDNSSPESSNYDQLSLF